MFRKVLNERKLKGEKAIRRWDKRRARKDNAYRTDANELEMNQTFIGLCRPPPMHLR